MEAIAFGVLNNVCVNSVCNMALTQKNHQLDGVLEIHAWCQGKSRPCGPCSPGRF